MVYDITTHCLRELGVTSQAREAINIQTELDPVPILNSHTNAWMIDNTGMRLKIH